MPRTLSSRDYRSAASEGHGFMARFMRFGLVGASGVAVNALVLAFLVEGLEWHYAAAALVAIEISTISNYLINRRWTWKDRDGSWWSLITYHGVTLAGAAVQYLTLVTAVERFSAHYLVASLIGVGAGMVLNFIGNDRLTFQVAGQAGRAAARRTARYMLAGTAMLTFAALLEHPWDGFVFRRTVEDWIVAGQTPYQVAQAMPLHAFMGSTYPIAAQWFAYPPVALIALTAAAGPAVAFDAPLWVLRMVVKLPAIVGVLVSARLAYALVLPRTGKAAAVRTERWMLFGPIALVVAGIWGQFEPLLVAFLLAAVVALEARRWRLAGLGFALAVLTKPFALFLAPVWIIHIYRHAGWLGIRRAVATGAAAGIGLCLPFLLASPSGFWHQVVGMHAARPPANFSILTLPYLGLRWLMAHWTVEPTAAITAIGILSMALTAAVLVATARSSRRDPADLVHLMKWSTLAFGGALLFGKVVNEQYLFIPFAFALLWANAAHPPSDMARRLVPALGLGVAGAALVHGLHFILFIPQDVWSALVGDPVQIVRAINIFLLPLAPVDVVKGTAALMLVPAAWILAPGLWRSLQEMSVWIRLLAKRRRAHVPIAGLLVLAIILGPSFGGAAPEQTVAAESEATPVIVLVRSDWWNPGSDPRIPAGRWLHVDEVPADGYYSATAAKAQQDATTLAGVGVDGIILVVDPALERQGRAWRMALDRVGIPYTIATDGDVVTQLPLWHTALYDRPEVPEHLKPWLPSRMDLGLHPAEPLGRSNVPTFEGSDAAALGKFLDAAQASGAPGVILPWNDFGGLGGIEPTESDAALDALRHWSAATDDSGGQPPPEPRHGALPHVEPFVLSVPEAR